jgi:hypothetical protein
MAREPSKSFAILAFKTIMIRLKDEQDYGKIFKRINGIVFFSLISSLFVL